MLHEQTDGGMFSKITMETELISTIGERHFGRTIALIVILIYFIGLSLYRAHKIHKENFSEDAKSKRWSASQKNTDS